MPDTNKFLQERYSALNKYISSYVPLANAQAQSALETSDKIGISGSEPGLCQQYNYESNFFILN